MNPLEALKTTMTQTPPPTQSASPFMGADMPPPAPAARPAQNPLMDMAPKVKSKYGTVGNALDKFNQSFAPEHHAAQTEQRAMKEQEAAQQQLATLEQIRALPMEQRQALLPQLSAAIGQEVPASMMSDQEIDKQLAIMRGQLGISPEKAAAPEYKGYSTGDGAFVSFDPTTGEAKQVLDPRPSAENQPKLQTEVGGNGNYWTFDPTTGTMKDTGVRAPPPSAGVTVNNNAGGPEPTIMQKEVDKAWAPILVEWQRLGASDSLKQLSQLDSVVRALESGENLTGPMLGAIDPGLRALFNPNSVNNQQQVEEVVQRNLRAVLGAQFTQKEGDRLIARAYNPQLDEATNKQRLARLIGQMSLSAQQIEAALNHANSYGTMVGFSGKLPTVADFDAALDQAGAPRLEMENTSVSPAEWDAQMQAAQERLSPEEFKRYQELKAKQQGR